MLNAPVHALPKPPDDNELKSGLAALTWFKLMTADVSLRLPALIIPVGGTAQFVLAMNVT